MPHERSQSRSKLVYCFHHQNSDEAFFRAKHVSLDEFVYSLLSELKAEKMDPRHNYAVFFLSVQV